MRTLLHYGLLVCLVSAVAALSIGCKKETEKQAAKPPAPTPPAKPAVAPAPAAPVRRPNNRPLETVVIRDFLAEFKANTAAAKEKYEGAKVEIHGVADLVRQDSADNGLVNVLPPPPNEKKAAGINCFPADQQMYKTLGSAQPIRVLGTVALDPFDNPKLVDAVITLEGPTTLVVVDAGALSTAFAQDPAKVTGLYQVGKVGKRIQVTGKVVEKQLSSGSTLAGLYLGDASGRVICQFDGSPEALARRLEPIQLGATVTVAGYYSAPVGDQKSPKLTQCIVVAR